MTSPPEDRTSIVDQSATEIARRSAMRLTELDPALPARTESALAGGTTSGEPTSYEPFSLLALGGFVVTVAKFAWDVYKDVKKGETTGGAASAKSAAALPSSDAVARRIRVDVELPSGMSPETRDRIVTVVVEEALRAATTRT